MFAPSPGQILEACAKQCRRRSKSLSSWPRPPTLCGPTCHWSSPTIFAAAVHDIVTHAYIEAMMPTLVVALIAVLLAVLATLVMKNNRIAARWIRPEAYYLRAAFETVDMRARAWGPDASQQSNTHQQMSFRNR
jgi:hypothetical protein